MRNWLKGQKQQRALKLVLSGVSRLRRRLGHGPVIRPFLQAYSSGADYYTPAFITEQIVASRQGGADGFLFWHPGSNYRLVRAAMAGPARGQSPFPIEKRQNWRRDNYGERVPSDSGSSPRINSKKTTEDRDRVGSTSSGASTEKRDSR